MLIDPTYKNYRLNVEEWNSDIINNEFSTKLDMAGYSYSSFKGTERRFECSGTILDSKLITYLSSLIFDDVVEIELDITEDNCDLTTTTNKIKGFILIDRFDAPYITTDIRTYSMEGVFFPYEDYKYQYITTFWKLPNVVYDLSTATSLNCSNETISVHVAASIDDTTVSLWKDTGIIITGNIGYVLKPTEFLNYPVFIETIDIGDNVCKYMIITKDLDKNIIDVSYAIINRGGFRLETNTQWNIIVSGYTKCHYKTIFGTEDTNLSGEMESSFIFVSEECVSVFGNHDKVSGNISNGIIDSITTKWISGNVITITNSDHGIIGGSTGGSISSGYNITVLSPSGGEQYTIYDDDGTPCVDIPIDFTINDGSRVGTIVASLMTDYRSDWTFGDTIASVTLDTSLKYGGRVTCHFEDVIASQDAGIKLTITYLNGATSTRYNKKTFVIGSYTPLGKSIKQPTSTGTAETMDMLFPVSAFNNGIYDLYFTFNTNAGNTMVDLGLFASQSGAKNPYKGSIDAFRTILTGYFTPGSLSSTSLNTYGLIDYGPGGMHLMMKDRRNIDTGVSSKSIFKRTILINSNVKTFSNLYSYIKNMGYGSISSFSVYAVPIYSHNTEHYIGDYANANAPNIKNKIIVPV